jgi:F0F1-type ATP synthase membrane subunit b/b'|tara:strand:- start:110 stop:397 length:288 start_codon:yes stop_codon:yes gene_type:complete
MDFYKKAIFLFVLFLFFMAVFVKMIEPVIENQISSIFAERKMSNKLKKELQKSTEQFTPEKREFYKDIIKKLYIKWKPLIDESVNEAESEITKNN